MTTRAPGHTTAAPAPSFTPVRSGLVQRKCACGGGSRSGACAECAKGKVQRRPAGASGPREDRAGAREVPPIVRDVLGAPGWPLEPGVRSVMEGRFGHDFGHVRVHTDAKAAASAQAIDATAYALGPNVVFASGYYAPDTLPGRRVLAHELSHVLQQEAAPAPRGASLVLGDPGAAAELEAERAAMNVDSGASARETAAPSRHGSHAADAVGGVPAATIQRQLITPLAPGGGFQGLMERDRRRAAAATAGPPAAASPYRVCSRDLQGVLGAVANHAYIDAPPYRYAVISPLCPKSRLDNVVTGTTAQKWDNSKDPCGKTPTCIDCTPLPGVTDVGKCLRSAFAAYNNPSLYRGLGPNSNTFAGTLARACCAGMVPKPPALGNVPGWDDAPAAARAGATPCPPGPTC